MARSIPPRFAAAMDRPLKRTILVNVLASVCARVLLVVVGVIMTPYMLYKLGNDDYGLWVLVSAMVGSVAVLDFGFGTSLVKYVAEYHARNDPTGLNAVVSAALKLYLALSGVILLAGYVLIDPVLGLLSIPPTLAHKARLVLQLGILTFVWTNFTGVYQSVMDGLQRMHVSYAVLIGLALGNAGGTVLVLELGFGVVGLGVNQLVVQAIGLAVMRHLARHLCPTLRVRFRGEGKYFGKLWRYGLNLQISRLTELVDFQLDKLLINHFVDVAHVAFYDVASRVPMALRSFPALALSVLTPASSQLQVRKGRGELYELYYRVSKYVAFVAFPIFTGVAMTAPWIIGAWVGPSYALSVTAMRILCLAYLCNIVAGPVSPLVQGIGRPDYQRNAETLKLALNAVISTLLIRRYGFQGVGIGVAVAMAAGSAYYLWAFHRLLARPLLPFFAGTLLRPVLASLLSGLAAFGLALLLTPYASGTRGASALVLLATSTLFAITYLLVILKARYFDARDAALLGEVLPFVRAWAPVGAAAKTFPP